MIEGTRSFANVQRTVPRASRGPFHVIHSDGSDKRCVEPEGGRQGFGEVIPADPGTPRGVVDACQAPLGEFESHLRHVGVEGGRDELVGDDIRRLSGRQLLDEPDGEVVFQSRGLRAVDDAAAGDAAFPSRRPDGLLSHELRQTVVIYRIGAVRLSIHPSLSIEDGVGAHVEKVGSRTSRRSRYGLCGFVIYFRRDSLLRLALVNVGQRGGMNNRVRFEREHDPMDSLEVEEVHEYRISKLWRASSKAGEDRVTVRSNFCNRRPE